MTENFSGEIRKEQGKVAGSQTPSTDRDFSVEEKYRVDAKDVLAGLVLFVFGTAIALYVWAKYPVGTPGAIQLGFLPMAMGVIIAIFGLMIAVPAFFRRGDLPRIDVIPMLSVLGSVVIFAVLIRPFGLVPAIFGLTYVASLADDRLTLSTTFVLATGLSLLAYLIFPLALAIPMTIIAIPGVL